MQVNQVSRRAFLQGLFGVSAGLLLAPQLEAVGLGYADEVIASADPLLVRITAGEAWRLFREIATAQRHEFDLALDKTHYVGERLPTGVALRHMLGVDFQFGEVFDLRAPISQMVTHARYHGLGIYARLELPRAIEAAEAAGPLRLCQFFDPVLSSQRMRFDLLGAVTERNQRHAWQLRGEQAKARMLAEQEARRFRVGMYSHPALVDPVRFPR